MFSFGYAWNELRRRIGRTIVTAVGLAAGVGLVMGIIGVSQGLSDAQNKALSPLNSVGTAIIVTRTVAPTMTTTTTTTTPFNGFGGGGGGAGAGAGGGGFFGGRGGAALNSSDAAALAAANSSVITDLAKLGPAGTKFTHDFFVPGTLITFPTQAVSDVLKVKGVTSAVGALSLDALHETGTVPTITASVKTGGQTISASVKPPVLTAAQQAAERTCIEGLINKQLGSTTTTIPSGGGGFGGGGGAGFRFGAGASSAFAKCLTPAQKAYEANVVVPERTVEQVPTRPTTNTQTSTYTVAGVNPSNTTSGLVTKAQLTKGSWLSTNPATAKTQVLVTTAYASQKGLKVGQTLTINKVGYTIVGLVNPTLTGDVSDIYFSISNLQSLSSNDGRINEVLVSVANAKDVNGVAKAIKKELPGATVLTSASLADQVTGSLSNARKLANDLGGALAVVVLLAAFLIAGLFDLVKRVQASTGDRVAAGHRLVPCARRSPDHGRDRWHRHHRRGAGGGAGGHHLSDHWSSRARVERDEHWPRRGRFERERTSPPNDERLDSEDGSPDRPHPPAHHRARVCRRTPRRRDRRRRGRLACRSTFTRLSPSRPRLSLGRTERTKQ